MAVPNITVLSLLGKEVSFYLLLDDQKKVFFPDGIHVAGSVDEVIISVNGNHQILVEDEFYSVSDIQKIYVTTSIEFS